MHPRPNPTGIELAVAAGLAVAGVTGLVMGRRILHPWKMPTWVNTVTPHSPESEIQERSVPELGPLSTSWMDENYPNTDCERKGEAYGFSVTGPDDGFALLWEIHASQGEDERWLLLFRYSYPGGSGGGTDVARDRASIFAALAKMEGAGFQAYRERQAFRGDPNVGAPSTFTSVVAC